MTVRKALPVFLAVLMVGFSAAEIEFNHSDSIEFNTELDMANNPILNLPDPSGPGSPVTLGYLQTDWGLSSVLDANNQASSNIDMSGFNLTNVGNINPDAGTEDYLTLEDAGPRFVNRSGDSMTGDLNMNANSVSNVSCLGDQC